MTDCGKLNTLSTVLGKRFAFPTFPPSRLRRDEFISSKLTRYGIRILRATPDYAWPSDLIALERSLPSGPTFNKWRQIEGKEYYIPGEVCDPIGKHWFWVEGDLPRADSALTRQFADCKARGVNLLLDVPPNNHGLVPGYSIQALNRLRMNANI